MSDSESSYDFQQHYVVEAESSERGEFQGESSSISYVEPPVSNLQSTFSKLDKQGKGFIRKSLLKETIMLTSQQYDKQIIKQEIDQCGDEINYSRFIDIFKYANIGDSINQWLFTLYDKDRKGYIDLQDLRRAAIATSVELSEQEMDSMLNTQRSMGSRQVDYQDFRFIMEEEIQYL